MTTKTYTQITEANAAEFVGREVYFDYGAMCGGERGWVVGHETTRWGTHLIAMTGEGKQKTINGFSTVGIGCHLRGEG